jgi:HNH endonuclease
MMSEPQTANGIYLFGSTWTTAVGSVQVTGAEIEDAIKILEGHPKWTAVKQPLQQKGNPLGQSDYRLVAEEYRSKHPDEELASGTPQQHAAHVKAAFLGYLKEVVANHPDGEVKASSPADQALAAAEAHVAEESATEPLPDSDYDARQRVYQQIVRRRGQGKFRSALVDAYAGQCAITGNSATDALEAAHLIPYQGPKSNIVANGLLLRADIHTLLDLQFLAIDPVTRTAVVSPRLQHTEYQILSGVPLREPTSPSLRPSQAALEYLWKAFQGNTSK